jgi:glycosyltransferase involved in cell wall biosynthesis
MSSKERRVEFGKAARVFAQRFSWPIIADKVERLYKKIIGRDRYGLYA